MPTVTIMPTTTIMQTKTPINVSEISYSLILQEYALFVGLYQLQ